MSNLYPAAEHFGLFLTALRNTGVDISLSDEAVAEMVVSALECSVGDYGTQLVDDNASAIALEMRQLLEVSAFVSDNGLSGEEG